MYTCGPVLHKAHPLPHNMQKAMEGEEYEIYMYAFKSMVHGYHVYQEMWVADVGEELSCVKETENHQDPFSVSVVSIYAHTCTLKKYVKYGRVEAESIPGFNQSSYTVTIYQG